MLQSMLFDVMFLNRYGGDGAPTNTRMDQHSSQLVFMEFGKSPLCNSQTVNNVIPPSQTQSGLLATAVPHSIPAKPRKVCILSPSLMTVNVVVCAYASFDVMMSLQVM